MQLILAFIPENEQTWGLIALSLIVVFLTVGICVTKKWPWQ